MAVPAVTDITDGQIEAVRRVIPTLFESNQKLLFSKIHTTSKVQKVNRKYYRIPVELYPEGAFGKFTANGGTLGSGTSFKLTALTAGYFQTKMGFQLTQEMLDTSDDSTSSVVNAFQRMMARAMNSMQIMYDIALHTDGTGKLTVQATATTAANKLTFGDAGLGINRLREGMAVDVWDTLGTTKRAGAGTGPIIITNIDYSNKIVTFDQNITAIAADDQLAFQGMDIYGPAGLTSFSANWPAGAATAAGLGGDSFLHGIYYSNDNTAANYYLGIQKSAVSALLPAYVSGASGALTFSHGHQLLNKIRQRRDESEISGMIGIFHQTQREQVFNIGMAIANRPIGNSFGQSVDLMPSNQKLSDQFEYCGIPCFISKRQYNNRVDFIIPSQWGRAESRALDFHTNMEGKRIFEGRNSSGEVTSLIQWFLTCAFDYVNFDPGLGGYIDSLSIPS